MKILFPIAVVVMGFSGLVAQILLLRELLIVFSGNELSIGIILANALILEAFGSFYLGKRAETSKHKLESFMLLTILFCVSLVIAILLIRILRNMMGISIGESIGFIPILYSSFLILMPVSILHGALFTYCCRIYSMFSGGGASSVGKVYVYETLGAIFGGVVCAYLLIPYFDSFQAASWLALLNLIICLALLMPSREIGRYRQLVLAISIIGIVCTGYFILGSQAAKLHDQSISWQWKNQDIVHYQNSQYGNICITENQGQYIFFVDGVPNLITPVPDIPLVEEFVHIPLLAQSQPMTILILSGGAGGVINEILKHPSIESITYAELDPLILDLIKTFPTPLTETELNDRRVKVKHVDGRLLLRTSANKYDAVFVGIQEPSNLQTNRFFTKEFFSLAKKQLHQDGILVIGLTGSLDYLNEELVHLNSCVFNTLKRVFSHVRVVPGDGTNLYLASDAEEIVRIDRERIGERLIQRNLAAERGIPWHIEKKLHPGWQSWFSRFLEGGTEEINTDFRPLAMFYSISHWNALLAPSLRGIFRQFERIDLRTITLFAGISLLIYCLLLTQKRRYVPQAISYSIITTGFAGMIFDLTIIFAFQAVYGYVFSWIGILVASFMAGAACGALVATMAMARIKNCLKLFVLTEVAVTCFSFGLPVVLFALHNGLDASGFVFIRMLILLISFVSGLLTGCQFPLANELYLKSNDNLSRTAGLLYASDLVGGWFGGILGAVLLLPVLGLTGTCISVGLLKITSLVVIVTQSNRRLLRASESRG
ncbi:MAG: fused MFS/spermidine synthase [Desulfofustis sp.]|nr:fused MFS/spermidine synthase [Desulfofustis sp.]